MPFDRHSPGATPPVEEPAAVDLSAFGPGDLARLALQRSEVLAGLNRAPGRIVRAWVGGDEGPLARAVGTLGDEIARRAVAAIGAEWAAIAGEVASVEGGVQRIADIGCGYGIVDLFAARATGADLVLIDIEESDARHFGFAAEGAGYADLGVARRFLEANGVAPGRITCVNPKAEDPAGAGQVDLVWSFLSCGFHYPVATYLPYLRAALRPGGRAIFDLRAERAAGEIAALEALGRVRVLGEAPKRVRVVLDREEGSC